MMKVTLHVWRQRSAAEQGRFVTYQMDDVSPDMSFLEMFDVLNEQLTESGDDPIAFDHDCREGICGSCAMMVDGVAHGPRKNTTVCQLHMREFPDGAEITVEPWRAEAFPVMKDLVVNRSSFDRVIASGGFISASTGRPVDANTHPVPKQDAEEAFEAAACIGCGACVAACPNASAMLFVGAKVSHLRRLPQGQPERGRRVRLMVEQMDSEGFGGCTNHGECHAVCPKGIPLRVIQDLNREYFRARLRRRDG